MLIKIKLNKQEKIITERVKAIFWEIFFYAYDNFYASSNGQSMAQR